MSPNKCVERTLHPRPGSCVRTSRAAGSCPLTHDVGPASIMKKIAGIALLSASVAWGQTGYFQRSVQGTVYHVYSCRSENVGIYWADSNGVPFRTFAAVCSNLTARGQKVRFLMNGGIFEAGGVPSGLLVEDGVVKKDLNLRSGVGNFYLKPNGVFYIDEMGAHIAESSQYGRNKARPVFAVQSGPLLLSGGAIHNAFKPASSNRLHRNGIGILPNGWVILAETEQIQDLLPNLHEFAQFFRQAGCKEALFLDGDLSQYVVLPTTNALPGNHFGSIIGCHG
jgi:uncharacterized protein YigE (DUF2233 family)